MYSKNSMAISWRSLVLVVFSLNLLACASTEELYAEYEHQCRVSVVATATGTVVVEEGVNTMLWEPAVYFKYDKSDLEAQELARLDSDIKVLMQYPELNINVRGFTDSIATEEYNIALAKRRVNAVIEYLEANQINPNRIRRAPLGESLPLANNDSYENRAINRRVELLLLDQTGRAAPIRVMDDRKDWLSPINQSQPGTEKDWRR